MTTIITRLNLIVMIIGITLIIRITLLLIVIMKIMIIVIRGNANSERET